MSAAPCFMHLMWTPTDGLNPEFVGLFQRGGATTQPVCWGRSCLFMEDGPRLEPLIMYKLDTTTMIWTLINTRGTSPPASYGHSATIIGTKMFVFGGLYTIRVFDTETNCWLNTTSTQPTLLERPRVHSAFTYNGELYIFDYTNQAQNDVWKFSPETFSWKKVEPKGKGPPPI